MAVFAVYIEKQEAYFGGVRRFGNTYHYQTAPGQTFQDEALANEVAAAEREVTSSAVEFVAWRTWGPTDGPVIDSIIRDEGSLSGVGLGTPVEAMYREVCALVVWPLARSAVLNRKRWLRKFIRVPGINGLTLSAGIAAGTAPMPQSTIDVFNADYTSVVRELGTTETIGLCSALGDEPVEAGTVRPFLYTRQIGS